MSIHVCLVGNPNSGKTTLFNALTGARQRVGNWPGVTVEKKTGQFLYQDRSVEVTDLPGTYSLSVISESGSLDERIACEFILSRKATLIINILDAANLERNLYLTSQLLEMNIPVILAVNMMDIAKQRGLKLDLQRLEELTGCPVIPIVARKQKGVEQLKHAIVNFKPQISNKPSTCGARLEILETAIVNIAKTIDVKDLPKPLPARWLAIRLLENDAYVQGLLADQTDLSKTVESERHELESIADESTDIVMADSRYAWISDLYQQCSQQNKTGRRHLTDWIDSIVLNRWLGIPIFLMVMYLMFEFSITIGGALQPLFDDGSRTVFIDGINYLGTTLGFPLWLTALFAQGVGLGLNTVLTFIPQIGTLFLFLSFVEDSGYMTRAAFVMDRLMQAVGLPGKSFVPLIVGFGCNVPSIVAARTLDTRRDRLLTIMMAPFMSCGARLAIFAVFSSAFFPRGGALIVFLLYIIGIVVAILTALIVKHTLLKGKPAPFMMELPPYHLPNSKTLFIHTWQRLKGFVWRAGKIIVPICILIGSLNAIELNGTVNPDGSSKSILSTVSRVITPVFHPMGVTQSNWPATVGLITGTLAKEVVVGTLNTLYTQNQNSIASPDQFDLWGGLKQAWQNTYQSLAGLSGASFANPFTANEADHNMSSTAMGGMVLGFGSLSAAFAYMLFVLLYIPCVSTIAATAREANKAWAYLSSWWSLSIAYGLAVIAYQVLNFLSHPLSSAAWIIGMLVYLGALIYGMHYYADHPALTDNVPARKADNSCISQGSCHS